MGKLEFSSDLQSTLNMSADLRFLVVKYVRTFVEPQKIEPTQDIVDSTELNKEADTEDDSVDFPFKQMLESAWYITYEEKGRDFEC